jgi:hypothetical protein
VAGFFPLPSCEERGPTCSIVAGGGRGCHRRRTLGHWGPPPSRPRGGQRGAIEALAALVEEDLRPKFPEPGQVTSEDLRR